MARAAQKFTTLKAVPSPLPAGCELVDVTATVAEGSGKERVTEEAILQLFVPQFGNAEGIVEFGKFYTAHNGQLGDGNAFISGAIRSAVRSGVARLVKPGATEVSSLILAPPSDIRTVDKASLVGIRMAAWSRENPGKVPDAAALKEIYAGLVG